MTEAASKPKGGIMRWVTSGVAILAGVMGLTMVAEAGNRGLSPIINTISFCRDKTSTFPESAFNSFSPVSAEFMQQIGKVYEGTIEEASQYKVALIALPKHGQVQLLDDVSQHWRYVPEKGYTGADRAIYLMETFGKQYRVVVNFWVVPVIDENRETQECDSIKFDASGGSGSMSSRLTPISLSDHEAWQRRAI